MLWICQNCNRPADTMYDSGVKLCRECDSAARMEDIDPDRGEMIDHDSGHAHGWDFAEIQAARGARAHFQN